MAGETTSTVYARIPHASVALLWAFVACTGSVGSKGSFSNGDPSRSNDGDSAVESPSATEDEGAGAFPEDSFDDNPNSPAPPAEPGDSGSPPDPGAPPVSAPPPTPPTKIVQGARYVALNGNDSATGTKEAPYRTIRKGLLSLGPGGTLYIRGGVYTERVSATVKPGTAGSPVLVAAYPGDPRVVVKGVFWIREMSYWTLDGINVTWDSSGNAGEHMVKLLGGDHWTFTNAEVWGAHSFAGISVSRGSSGRPVPTNWTLSKLVVHDTFKSNGTNQDHLIYVAAAGAGLIEHCVLYNSENGRGVKLGNPGGESPHDVVIRYNTFYNNLGPSNVQLSFDAKNNDVYRNILVKTQSRYESVTTESLSGSGNKVHHNVYFLSDGIVEAPLRTDSPDTNVHVDPEFVSVSPDVRATSADLHLKSSSPAKAYGAYATP